MTAVLIFKVATVALGVFSVASRLFDDSEYLREHCVRHGDEAKG